MTCHQPELWSTVGSTCCPSSAQKQTERLLAMRHREGMEGKCMGHLLTQSEEVGDGVQNKVYGGQQETTAAVLSRSL